MQATYQVQATQGHVLCCLCGTSILPNPSNMCVNCLRSQVDITSAIQKQVSLIYCSHCGRYLQPPKHWVRAELESKELLTICLKKIKGLNKVKLVDASFIWQEPHSKRVKVKLTVQAEVLNGAILQQTFPVDFTVEWNMCPDCNRASSNSNAWVACVQVRQHVAHKRTFMFLEQLLLKHSAATKAVNVKDIHEGLDFYFASRAHALRLVDFLQASVPIRFRNDKQLVSHDTHSNTYNYKYTFSVEISPVCKDDVLCLPAKAASGMGHVGPVVLCTRVTNALQLMDVNTMRVVQVEATAYWRQPYTAIMSSRQLVEYVVLDIEPLEGGDGAHYGGGAVAGVRPGAIAEAQVARISDFGRNDTVFFARTHLGHLLHPGDKALGYDLANANLVGEHIEAFLTRGGSVPDVVLVRKSYSEKTRRRKTRNWQLKHMDMEVAPTRKDTSNEEEDRERFLRELEEDPDMRARVNLYRKHDEPAGTAAAAAVPMHVAAPAASGRRAEPAAKRRAPAAPAAVVAGVHDEEDEDEEDELPEVPLEELLDDMDALELGSEEEDEEGDEGEEEESDTMMEG